MTGNITALAGFGLAIAGWISTSTSTVTADQDSASDPGFWFKPKEIFPIEWGITHLGNSDFDLDGREDLLVVENNRARIHLLWNRDPDSSTDSEPLPGNTEINSLPPDARFEMDSITTERRIIDLAIGDLNNDGLDDIAYFGQPDGLVIHFNQGKRKWQTPLDIPAEPGQVNMNSIEIGDLNGDALNDLILLTEEAVYVFHQKSDNTLGEPSKLPLSSGVRGIFLHDFNSDGANDLVLLAWETKTPIRVRCQKNGILGPEIHYQLPSIGAYDIRDLNGDNSPEIICIESRSNDVCVYQLTEQKLPEIISGLGQGQIQLLALDVDSSRGNTFLWTDLSGDGRDDLILPDPQSGQVIFIQQDDQGRLINPKKFPSLSGISRIASGDWNNDGTAELFLLSPDEKSVGTTRLDELGKIPFPEPVQIKGLPLAMGFGEFSEKSHSALVVIAEEPDESRRVLQIFRDGQLTHSQMLDKDYMGTPSSVHVADADQDGFTDILLVTPYQDMKILRGTASDFDEIDVPSPGGTTESGMLSLVDFNGDKLAELVFAIKNYIRITTLQNAGTTEEPNWGFKVLEQVNGSSASSIIRSPVYFPKSDAMPETLALLDTDKQHVSFCRRDESGTWIIDKNYQLDIEGALSMQKIQSGPDKRTTLAISGENFVSWIAGGDSAIQLTRSSQYQTRINRGKLYDLIAGDLNNNNVLDLIFLEADQNHIEIARIDKDLSIDSGVYWKVFEKQSFRTGPGASGEPREFKVADFNGDGKADLVVLVHDRIILYPQD